MPRRTLANTACLWSPALRPLYRDRGPSVRAIVAIVPNSPRYWMFVVFFGTFSKDAAMPCVGTGTAVEMNPRALLAPLMNGCLLATMFIGFFISWLATRRFVGMVDSPCSCNLTLAVSNGNVAASAKHAADPAISNCVTTFVCFVLSVFIFIAKCKYSFQTAERE